MNRLLLHLVIFLLATGFVFAAGEPSFVLKNENDKEVNSILASVNGEAVSLRDILPYTKNQEHMAYASCRASDLQKTITSIRLKAVDDLIDRRLIIADYHNSGIKIPVQDIDTELDRVAENMGARSRADFIAKLRRNGVAYEKMRQELEEHMAIQLMLHRTWMSGRTTTPEELYKYYEKNKAEFEQPDKIELAMILVEDAAAAEKIKETLCGEPERFEELALKYSKGPGSENGGRLGVIEVKRLRSLFAEAIKEYADGKIYGPLKSPEGIIFLKINKYIPGSTGDYFSVLPELRTKFEEKHRRKCHEEYKRSLREKAVIRYFFRRGEVDVQRGNNEVVL